MYHGFKIAVVVPAYCEEAKITGALTSLPELVDHIVAIDDASTDRTYEALKSIQDPRVTVLKLPQNGGVGAATLAGFKQAIELSADILVKMDGDGQMDPARLPALLEPICRGEADYVKGNRFLHTRELVQMPLLRRLGNIGLSFMTKLASGYWAIFDPTNGYVAIHSAVAKLLDPERVHKRFFFESSILLDLGLHRAVVKDVYLPARYRDETSTLSKRRALLEFPPLLLKGFLRRLLIQYFVRDFNAVSLFVIAGVCSTSFGTLWGLYHWMLSAESGIFASTGTVMIAVLPLILGLQLLLQAIVMDVQNAPAEPIHDAIVTDARSFPANARSPASVNVDSGQR
jgi:glycosyltransferase involved in cell wall biosynthesis